MKTKLLILMAIISLAVLSQIYLASALTINSVTANPTQIQPGQQVSLSLSIRNDNLDFDVKGVTINLNLNGVVQQAGASQQTIYAPVPFSPYQSSNSRTIDSINSDDHESVGFNLVANSDAASGTYNIPVTASYTIENGTNGTFVSNEFLGVITVIVNAKPNIVVSSVGNALIKGQTGKITIQIVNSGLGPSDFLSVSLGDTNGISTTSADNVYIGNINSNDFDSADFNVFVNPDAPSTINLPVQITYSDSQNNQVSQSQTIALRAYTSQEAKSLGLISGNSSGLIIFLIILAVIGFFVYRSIRKRIRNKKNGSH